ncbi:MAG TPA: AI-2E family transporter [Pseudogracilibacillus sp.]|nr:AI-2E family transporter [Pseudogracilibacillus sp.]
MKINYKTIIFILIVCILFIYGQAIGENMLTIIKFIWRTTYPFWLALFITYGLAPFVLQLERIGINRTIAILILFTWFLLALVVLLYIIYPYFVSQLDMFANQLPGIIELFDMWMNQMHAHVDTFPKMIHDQFYEISYSFLENIQQQIDVFLIGFTKKINIFFSLFITPFIVFYLLRDGHRWEALFLQLLAPKNRNKVIHIRDIALVHLSKYIWSQLFIIVIVACLMFIVYYFYIYHMHFYSHCLQVL